MQITSINSEMLAKMFLAGAKNLDAKKEWINELNVFPVPDGDTGTNMNLTYKSATKEVNECLNNNFDSLGEAIAKGALRGARGNSGVILSQIIKGMSTVIATSEKDITTKVFAKAINEGATVAYKAVTQPKEGTILTVAREISEFAVKCKKDKERMCIVRHDHS